MRLTDFSQDNIALELEETCALINAVKRIEDAEMKVIRRWLMWKEYLRLTNEKERKTEINNAEE